jgi:hypothetical protein
MSLTESNDCMPHYCKDFYTSCEVRYCVVFIILLIVFLIIAFNMLMLIICFAYLYNNILKMSCKCQDLHIDVYSQ